MDRFCIRCKKKLDRPINQHADYVMADDFIVPELREKVFALKHTPETLLKLEKEQIVKESEMKKVEVKTPADAVLAVEIFTEVVEENVQKTGLICPDCFNPVTDTVIWGYHKADPSRAWPEAIPEPELTPVETLENYPIQ